jgi:molybdopterin converting factor small subunit
MIKINIKCFSHVKYALKVDKLELEMPQGSTLKTLEKKIRAMANGELDGISLRMALNRKYTVDDIVLKEGDEVAFIPPVQGG